MKNNYKQLIAWQKAVTMVTEVYDVTKSFPREEIYALTSQIRRAAISIPSNIAEGQARSSMPEFRHFLSIAKGSMAELNTQLIIATNLGYLSDYRPLEAQLDEVARLVNGLLNSLKDKS